MKQFPPKDGQVLAPEPLSRLKTAFEALLTNRKERGEKTQKPGKRLYISIFKERLILLQIPQVNLWPVKCNRGIPNKRHQAWHVPWYLNSNGESSFNGQTPKIIYYLNQHSPTNQQSSSQLQPIAFTLKDSTSSEYFLLRISIAWKGVLYLLPKGKEGGHA